MDRKKNKIEYDYYGMKITGKTLVSGHRLFKLQSYDIEWIKIAIEEAVFDIQVQYGLSGAASGIDLWFAEILKFKNIPYAMYIPFNEQENEVEEDEKESRSCLIECARCIKKVRNSQMVSEADNGIIVWDGSKGDTHNVFQQMIEADKPVYWIEPKHKKIRKI